ncbi:Pimeloyl-ACP methyl ester carboxylesterase [Micromonospora pattaloongensis]|uniref:Pimeloyl-ACP methyl ester carboxylesterase n=1 Tax=Micromonospora pattaloongensis TaxID=405436 RepID=A0A1H3SZI6_9ACTN|nr:alpha/beta hydrolase [Micromonospora pattaloongensis]SDZ42499.1 Pimeloyl-ACP methyl ester carboxylesterase [Micromonospora pattaloongensis]
MTEQVADVGRGISIAYEQFGDAGAEPLVLIAGLGQQLHSWPTEFCARLAARGYRVTRFDNRDAGASTHHRYRPAGLAAMMRRRWPAEQYDLADLATDTVGLLDALRHDRVHLVGVSMGGMIAQTVTALYPERVRTLTSIMSTTGARRIGRPALSTWRLMAARPARSRQEAVDRTVRMFRHIGSHGFPFDEAWVSEQAGLAWDRDPSPAGTARQLAAIFRSGDRTPQVRTITAPTLVIHGDRDRMVHPTGGAATAAAIAGARLESIPGMGHDLPSGAWPVLLDLIDDHARRSVPTRSSDVQTGS